MLSNPFRPKTPKLMQMTLIASPKARVLYGVFSLFAAARSFTPLNTRLPTSYVLIMMAQLGATLSVRGIHPLHRPWTPSVLKISHSRRAMWRCGPSASRYTWVLVLPTSKGVVTMEAKAPERAPDAKLSRNVSVWFSGICARRSACEAFQSTGLPFLCSRTSDSRDRIASYPHQYSPEKGTSLQRVNVKPLHKDVYPCWPTIEC